MKQTTKTSILMVLAVLLMLVQSGCGSKELSETGFLSDYSRLEVKSDTVLQYIGPEANLYTKFIIEPVVTYLPPEDEVEPEELAELRQYMYTAVHNEVLDGYDVVQYPGMGVAKLRIALTDLHKSKVGLNVIPQTKLAGAGLGGAAMEAELVDSRSGKQIAAVVQAQKGSRMSLEGFSKWGDAKAVMKGWAKSFKGHLDTVHGR